MYKLSSCKSKVITLVALGVTTTSIIIASYRKWKRSKNIPTKWESVGQITDVYCFPIKSCGVVQVDEVNCIQIGVKERFLRDRTFMVVTSDGNFITARQQTKLVTIRPEILGNVLKLSAPDMFDIVIDMDKVINGDVKTIAVVWDAPVEVFDCGKEVSKWISNYILNKDEGLRLVYYPLEYPTRPVRPKNRNFSNLTTEHVGALHDASSFMMINQSSVNELNTRLPFKTSSLLFRPNFVVKGPQAFDEDSYEWIKVGNEAVFKVVKPCTRCVFTNIDPISGENYPNDEPLKTLKSYRKFPGLGDSPVMGIHLGVIESGNVKKGDTVYVGVA